MKNYSKGAAFKRAPVATACAVLIMAGAVQAQQLDPLSRAAGTQAVLGTVTITGIQAAIESAISVKKGADTIVEAISSEDIGKLPDPSVADSLARLPGVSAQRNKDSGKAQSISVRGMSPDFNGAVMNGREQASAGDSRGVDFDLFPGELLSGVLVYKTPHAGLVGQGLSSTIDLQTVRPLDYLRNSKKDMAISVNMRKLRSGIDSGIANGEGTGDRQTLSYVDQFADRKIGIALGFAKFKDLGAIQLVPNSWDEGKTLKFNGADVKVPGAFGFDNVQNTQKRDGAMGVLQFKPNANFETIFDFFYSKGNSVLKKNGIEGPVIGGKTGAADEDITKAYRGTATLIAAQVDANGVATSGTIDNYKGVIRNHIESASDELKSFGLNTKFVTGDWTSKVDLGRSQVTRNAERYETTAGLPGSCNVPGYNCDTISWTGFKGGNNADLGIQYKTGVNYSDPNVAKLTDVLGWGGGPLTPQSGYVANPTMSDTLTTGRVSTKRDIEFGPVNGLEVGINQSKREKVAATIEGVLVIKGGDPFGSMVAPGASVSSVQGIPILSWDPAGSLGTVYGLRPNLNGGIINRNWTVSEKVVTSFVKADLDGTLFSVPYTGNIGTQFVYTDQYSTAFNSDSAACAGLTVDSCRPTLEGTKYSDFLPSMNLAFDARDDQVVRIGIGRVMSRPKMGDMRSGLEVGWNKTLEVFKDAAGNPITGSYSGSGGNPTLQPFRANAYDVSYEKYFGGKKGYISVAGFYKDLQTYILNAGRLVDFTGKLTPNALAAAPAGASNLGILTSPFNGSGGNIKGVELAVSLPFSMVTSYLDGFGFAVNHSDTSSSIVFNPTSLPNADPGLGSFSIPLPGLSRQVTNSRFFYEKNGIQIAIANRKRSDFIGEIADYKDDRKITWIAGDSVTDLQVGYEFQSGYLKGLALQLQAQNLNNAPFITFTDNRENGNKTYYGKTYLFGLNYKY
jgi:iron complex outermembrane receptor protein